MSQINISGTKAYVDVEDGGRTARFAGELGIDGFYAIKSTMRWLDQQKAPTRAEVEEIIAKVAEEVEKSPNKAYFRIYFD